MGCLAQIIWKYIQMEKPHIHSHLLPLWSDRPKEGVYQWLLLNLLIVGITTYFIRVVFDSVKDGEFWYQLDLNADNPKSTSISPISCELGKWVNLYVMQECFYNSWLIHPELVHSPSPWLTPWTYLWGSSVTIQIPSILLLQDLQRDRYS